MNISPYFSTPLRQRINEDMTMRKLATKTQISYIRGEHSHENPGYGMGLAIVARIAKLHNATLTITDSVELGGAEFCLTFNR